MELSKRVETHGSSEEGFYEIVVFEGETQKIKYRIELETLMVLIEFEDGAKVTINKDGVKTMQVEMEGGTSTPEHGYRVATLDDVLAIWQFLLGHQHIGNMGAPTPLFPPNVSEATTTVNTDILPRINEGGAIRMKE